jgi:hypothetical protein
MTFPSFPSTFSVEPGMKPPALNGALLSPQDSEADGLHFAGPIVTLSWERFIF